MWAQDQDMTAATKCQINTSHCEQCGSTDPEDLYNGDQGYSACCNEIVVWGSDTCRNHHGEDDTDAIDAEAFEMYRTLVAANASRPYHQVAARYYDPNNHFSAVDAIDRHLARNK
jgi:hypothetical protein